MIEELKPCPFCGIVVDIDENGFLMCPNCRYGFSFEITIQQQIDRWNCRPIDDAQAARIAELEMVAEVRKSANRLLEQERNALEAERDRLREALYRVERKINSAKTACTTVVQREFEEAQDIALKALEGAER